LISFELHCNRLEMNIERHIAEIKEFLEGREEVLLGYMFGSFVEGQLTNESDVDIALLFEKEPDLPTLVSIMNGITDITDRKVDIVVLNYASPIIRMQVLKRGRLLKKTNDKIYNDFFLRAVKEYDDLKIVRKAQEENILRGRVYVGK